MKIKIGVASDIGMKRNENQDSHAFFPPEDGYIHKKGTLFAIADGMGGHSGGAIASKIAINMLMETYYKDDNKNITDSLQNAFLKANQAVLSRGEEDTKIEGMGTTMTAAVIKKNKMYFGHVGDSRGYLIDESGISQFTEDHSFVASLVKAGAISEEEAKTHPEKNIITRAIGITSDLSVDVPEKPFILKDNHYILLCCDGLHGVVDDNEIHQIIFDYKDPDSICNKLIERANEQGGPDNITVMVALIENLDFVSSLKNSLMKLVR